MPSFATLNSGDVLDYDDVNDWMASLKVPFDSTHISSLSRSKARKKSGARVISVGGTANLDYFSNWFTGVSTSTAQDGSHEADTYADRFESVPRLSVSFKNPYHTAAAIVMWNVSWMNDSSNTGTQSQFMLFGTGDGISTAPFNDSLRAVFKSMFIHSGVVAQHKGLFKDRYYCGARKFALTGRGNYSFSLKLCASASVNQTRVRTGAMRVLLLNTGPS